MGACCRYTKQVIKGCDCFGTFITFRINDDLEYKSLMGGISSIFFFILASSYISYMSYYFITRQNVDFIFSKKTINDQPLVNFTQIGYRFAFGLQYMEDDSSAILNTTKYFNYSIREVQIFNSETYVETPIPIKFCTEADFRNQVNRTFHLRGLSKMYCPVLDNVNYTVEGTMMDPYYKYINLEIWLTDYSIKHFDEVQQYAKDYPLEMSYYFLDNAIDYENRKSPLPNFLNYLFKAVDVQNEIDVEIIKSPMEFANDENILFNNAHKIYGATIDNHVDSFHAISTPNELGQSMIAKYIVKASPIMFALSRSYQKLPSFVADLSGILEEVLGIILLTVNILERQAIDNKLIKKMLKFKGCKNYDVKYLLNVFGKDYNYHTRVMDIISKQKMIIKKNTIGGGIIDDNKNKALFSKGEKTHKEKYNLGRKRNNYYSDDDLGLAFKGTKNALDTTRDNIQSKKKEREGIALLTINPINNSISLSNEKKSSSSRSFAESVNSVNNPTTNQNLNDGRNKLMFITPLKIQTIKRKTNEENFSELGIFSALWSKMFFWSSKKLERRREFFTKAEDKIHYFFDVYNYIQKMQEIDLLVYTLLDNDQVNLFDFLSRPPLKINPDKMDIYNEFESRQTLQMKIGKTQIEQLHKSYNKLRFKDTPSFEDLKLLRLVNAEVKFLS